MTFKNWLKSVAKEYEYGRGTSGDILTSPETDFAEDVLRDKTWREPKDLKDLLRYLEARRACDGATAAAKSAFKKWQASLKPKGKVKVVKTDGLGPHEIKKIRSAVRLVWQRSHSRRLVVVRCTGEDGFTYCEDCKTRTPSLKVDHIKNVGDVDEGFITRMFVPSRALRGLCHPCHKIKTKQERAAKPKRIKSFL